MGNRKSAFTLIELLVVIAIIAILAAILFPVFAQAKIAAKKTAGLSNIKQTAVADAIYLNDSDDLFPTGYRFTPDGNPGGGSWRWNYFVSTPLGWMGPTEPQGQPARMAEDASHVSNVIQPYMKNFGLWEAPGAPTHIVYAGYATSGPNIQTPANCSTSYNGLLHAYNATSVVSPAQLTLFWNGRGNANDLGASLTNPALLCQLPIETSGACVYTPGTGVQGQSAGSFSGGTMFTLDGPVRLYSQGANFAYCDGHAKFVHLGDGNYKTDPYTGYDANGNPAEYWSDGNYPWLFRPDYDFSQ